MRDETVRALDDQALDYAIRCLAEVIPGLQHTLSVAVREQRRRRRVERHLAEKAAAAREVELAREAQIEDHKQHALAALHRRDHDDARLHTLLMTQEINARSPEQVARMEQKRGLR